MKRFFIIIGIFCFGYFVFFFGEPTFEGSLPKTLLSENTKKDATQQPKQNEDISLLPNKIWTRGETKLEMRATYQIDAVIKSKKGYQKGELAEVVPYDLALAWGIMAENKNWEGVEITQENRFCYWSYRNRIRVSNDEIIKNSANVHLIPRNRAIYKKIKNLSINETVRITGYLIDIDLNDGRQIKTSLTREDSGAGSCEIIWVEDIQ